MTLSQNSQSRLRPGIKVALVSHPLHTYGGAEYHFKVMTETFPDADIFTAWYDEDFTTQHFPDKKIVGSWLQQLPHNIRKNKVWYLLYNSIYSSFDFSEYDLVIVLTDGFEKNLSYKGDYLVILDILTPPRFLWMQIRTTNEEQLTSTFEKFAYRIYNRLVKEFLHGRWRDRELYSVRKANLLLANSGAVQERIRNFYEKESIVVYPPVELADYKKLVGKRKPEDWYLYLGRIENYKGVELAVRAAAQKGFKLKVAGIGSDLDRMKLLAESLGSSDKVEFLGYVEDKKKVELFNKCKALINPIRDEDFGLTNVEAIAAGIPVIVHSSGGALEVVEEGINGVFFKEYNEESLVDAVERFELMNFDVKVLTESVDRFDKIEFTNKLIELSNGLVERSGSGAEIN